MTLEEDRDVFQLLNPQMISAVCLARNGQAGSCPESQTLLESLFLNWLPKGVTFAGRTVEPLRPG